MQGKKPKPNHKPPNHFIRHLKWQKKLFFFLSIYPYFYLSIVLALNENVTNKFSLLKITLQVLILATRKLFDEADAFFLIEFEQVSSREKRSPLPLLKVF